MKSAFILSALSPPQEIVRALSSEGFRSDHVGDRELVERCTDPELRLIVVVAHGPDASDALKRLESLRAKRPPLELLLLCESDQLSGLEQRLACSPLAGSARCSALTPDPTGAVRGAARRALARGRSGERSDVASELPHRADPGSPPLPRLLEQLLEHAPMGVALVDGRGTIRAWNRKAAAILERPAAEVLGRPVSEVLPLDPAAPVPARLELEARGVSGAEQLLSLESVPVPSPGDEGLELLFFEDETHLRQLEERLHQTQRLEGLGLIAGGVAHDFNNFLVAVAGSTELARRELPESSPARPHLERVGVALRQCTDLCRQLLAYGGKTTAAKQPVDLRQLVDDLERLLQISIPSTTQLDCHVEPDLPRVRADASQLRQVLMNLVINASEALNGERGRVSVRLTATTATREQLRSAIGSSDLVAGDYVRVEVTDTGCGMDAATRRRIFDPFFSTKRRGRGLGLAAVLGIVRGHGGGLTVDSEPNRGTTFVVSLPRGAPAKEATAAAAAKKLGTEAPAPAGSIETVLLVEDEPAVLQTIHRLLERRGFNVLLASGGGQAVEVFRERHAEIDIVLMDVQMPDLDGPTTLRALQEINPRVRSILLSGQDAHEQVERFATPERIGFLAKPFRSVELFEAIDKLTVSQSTS